MAAYVISEFAYEATTVAGLGAAIETGLEALDSTNNPVVDLSQWFNPNKGVYEASLIVQGAP